MSQLYFLLVISVRLIDPQSDGNNLYAPIVDSCRYKQKYALKHIHSRIDTHTLMMNQLVVPIL